MTTVATGQVLLAGTPPAGLAASFAALHVVSQRARVLRLRRTGTPLANNVVAVLPSSYSEWSRHPDLRAFRSSIAPPTDASVYASRDTSRCPQQDSRSGWIRYFLSCRALASPTTCRFSPAHSGLPVTRAGWWCALSRLVLLGVSDVVVLAQPGHARYPHREVASSMNRDSFKASAYVSTIEAFSFVMMLQGLTAVSA